MSALLDATTFATTGGFARKLFEKPKVPDAPKPPAPVTESNEEIQVRKDNERKSARQRTGRQSSLLARNFTPNGAGNAQRSLLA